MSDREKLMLEAAEARCEMLEARWEATVNLIESLRSPLDIPPGESTSSVEFRQAVYRLRARAELGDRLEELVKDIVDLDGIPDLFEPKGGWEDWMDRAAASLRELTELKGAIGG